MHSPVSWEKEMIRMYGDYHMKDISPIRVIELDQKLMRYLLGELSLDERTQLEDRYIADQDFYEHMLIAEDEIIDTYVRGAMSERDSDLFRKNFLCSEERRERIKIARTLIGYSDAHASTHSAVREERPLRDWLLSFLRFDAPVMRMAVTAAAVVVLVGGVLGWVELIRLRSGLDKLRSEQSAQQQREESLKREVEEQGRLGDQLNEDLDRERSERGRLEQEVAKLREQQSAPAVFSLGSGLSDRPKGAPPEGRTVTIPRGREMVKFQLDLLADEYDSYLVIVRDARGQAIWQGLIQSARTASGSAIFVRLRSRLFSEGQHSFTLSGSRNNRNYEAICEFPISLVRK